jgi:G6PDH family F420-dependent oxidoreductase
MTSWGYTLSSEEHDPTDLVRWAQRAEELGFDFLTISDHFHPWIGRQGQSAFVWSTIGAVAARTERIRLGVGVNCPIGRYHPAIVAQAAATSAVLLGEGRFFLGVGTGELLNEHVVGLRWPTIEVRQQMLVEAVEIIRALWTGDSIDVAGTYFTVENARLYTRPEQAPEIIVSGFGPSSVELAARIGDGLWSTSPSGELLQHYRDAGGTGPIIGQATMCWAPDAASARRTMHEIWPNAGVPGQLSQDLPTPTHFEQVAALVTEDDAVGSSPMGNDPEAFLASLRTYEDAGYTHVHVHQVGPDQDGFFDFWEREVRPKL